MKFIAVLSRILVGLVFIFSGFVKGVDPLGTAYKIQDYFIAYHAEWAIPVALPLSIFLCTFEFSLGVLLVLNVRIRLVSWLTLLTMMFFTIITYYDAIENPVPDCGCFGDALILTNWQTFYKNLVIMAFVLLMFARIKKMKGLFSKGIEWMIVVLVFIVFASFSFYNYQHLPMMDFRAWKVGSRMVPENPLPKEYYIIYRNTATNEEKEYLSKDIPWQDSTWASQWEYVSTREYDPNDVGSHGLAIIDSSGTDVTDAYIGNHEFQFFIIAYDLQKTNEKAFERIKLLYQKTEAADISFIGITSSDQEEIVKFKEKDQVSFDFYFADDTSLETIIRSNPGLMLMKNGVVLGKWHYNDLPEFDELNFKELEAKYL